MGSVTTVGLDLAKNVFQVHGVDVEGVAVSGIVLPADGLHLIKIEACRSVPKHAVKSFVNGRPLLRSDRTVLSVRLWVWSDEGQRRSGGDHRS